MRCADLMMPHHFALDGLFILGAQHQNLGADQRIPQELGRAHHCNEFSSGHAVGSVVANNAIVNLFQAQPTVFRDHSATQILTIRVGAKIPRSLSKSFKQSAIMRNNRSSFQF